MGNSLKNKLKYDYENGSEIPSANLWDKLEVNLDASENKIVPVKSIKINWWKYAAIVLCLITLGIVFKYNFQDNSTKNINPKITKVETPIQNEIGIIDSAKNVQNNADQPEQIQELANLPKQEVITTQNHKIIPPNKEKFTANPQKFIQSNKEESQNPENVIEFKNIEKPLFQQEEKQIVANNTVNVPFKKSNMQYVKADELLFGRELQKRRESIAKEGKIFGEIDISVVQKIRPSSVKILGVQIYSEEESN